MDGSLRDARYCEVIHSVESGGTIKSSIDQHLVRLTTAQLVVSPTRLIELVG